MEILLFGAILFGFLFDAFDFGTGGSDDSNDDANGEDKITILGTENDDLLHGHEENEDYLWICWK